MANRRTRCLWTVLACGLSLSVAVPAAATETPPPPATDETGPAPLESDTSKHSSETDEPLLTARRAGGAFSPFFTLHQQSRPVAPGLELSWFDRYDARGWYRVNVLSADLSTPGLRMDYAAPGKISAPGPLSSAVGRDRAVAGVNGDFFDISDTGAPLGIGVDRQRGVLHGSTSGWNKTFTLDRRNVATIAHTFLEATVERPGRPALSVTDLNAPTLRRNGIGVYTTDWGADSRSRVLPGAGARREVVVRQGRVRANRKRLSSGAIPRGVLHLVGVGRGARQLSRLKVGSRATVSYGLDRRAAVAVGGSVIVLRNGTVLAPNDVEMHPRTAIGIDRDGGKIIIVAVDGRSSTSRGVTMRETGVLLKRLGAEDGLNLDGGGSSTMMARESGEPVRVVNDPSDGRLRSVPNGLGFAFKRGSGRVRGIRVETLDDAPDSHRVLRGLSRKLVARGHDETFAPVPARPRWSGSQRVRARRGPHARTVVVGRTPGVGTVTATAAGRSGRFRVHVLGRVRRLETSVPTLSLAGRGARGTLGVRGYDGRGFGTWVEPRDLRLRYNRKKFTVTRTARGLRVISKVHSVNDVLQISAGGSSTAVGVAVGLARRATNRMNDSGDWATTSYPAASRASHRTVRNRQGRPGQAIAMSYALQGKRSPRAAYLNARPAQRLPARTRRVGMWVRGDRKGAMLRVLLRDAAGTRASVTLAPRVSWRGWRFVTGSVPGGLSGSLDLLRIYAVETRKQRRYSGTLVFDELTAFTERVATVPPRDPVRDAMVADREPLEPGGLRVAVLDGAGVSAAAPRSAAVARTRRAMREAVAARPGLVLMTGDLVRRGTSADLALARRLIREELEGKVDWRYVPGDGEVGPGGDLTAFRREFGNPVQLLDRAGTRIVLLNSTQGSFRLGGFQQLVRLRSALAGARRDRAISSVVVVAHHPTGDPMPGSDAELSDPREAELVEQLLADFRATSGKAVSYVGGHARRSATTRHDGVEQVLAGPVNAPDRRARGGFAGWSLLRADESGMRVEFRASVNRLRVLAPARLAVGTSAATSAVVFQTGRRVPVEYPMNARWLETPTVHVGQPADAPASAVLSYAPVTGRVTALKPGEADLTVEVNGRRARRTVSVG